MNLFQIKQRIKIKKLRKKGVSIGNGTILLNPISFFGSEPYLVSIGDNCLISANVLFTPHDGGTWTLNKVYGSCCDKIAPIRIGNNVYIGFGAIVFGGVHIGDNCIIGANSIVTKDVANNSVVCGAPAKFLCTLEEYKDKNALKFDPTFNYSYGDKKDYYIKKYKNK